MGIGCRPKTFLLAAGFALLAAAPASAQSLGDLLGGLLGGGGAAHQSAQQARPINGVVPLAPASREQIEARIAAAGHDGLIPRLGAESLARALSGRSAAAEYQGTKVAAAIQPHANNSVLGGLNIVRGRSSLMLTAVFFRGSAGWNATNIQIEEQGAAGAPRASRPANPDRRAATVADPKQPRQAAAAPKKDAKPSAEKGDEVSLPPPKAPKAETDAEEVALPPSKSAPGSAAPTAPSKPDAAAKPAPDGEEVALLPKKAVGPTGIRTAN